MSTEHADTSNITILGSNFGTATYKARGFDLGFSNYWFLRHEGITPEIWYNSEIVTRIPSHLPELCGAGLVPEVSNDFSLPSSLEFSDISFSYYPPAILSLSHPTAPTGGLSALTLTGTSFGHSSSIAKTSVMLGNREMEILSKTHTRLTVRVPSGTGLNLPLRVTVCDQPSADYYFSYDAPFIVSYAINNVVNAQFSQGATLTITGTSFGNVADDIKVYVGEELCTNVNIITPHTTLTCVIPHGCCTNQPLYVVTSGGTVAQQSNTVFVAYRSPVITQISPNNAATSGGSEVVVHGNHFFQATTSVNPRVPLIISFGPNQCQMGIISGANALQNPKCLISSWTNTSITIKVPPGEGNQYDVFVFVGDLYTLIPRKFTYTPPAISSLTPLDALTTMGGRTVTLTGSNFGVVPTVSICGRTCTIDRAHYATVTNHDTIHCVAPPGEGRDCPVVVTAGGQSSQVPYLVNYVAPSITSLTLDAVTSDAPGTSVLASTRGQQSLTIRGANFGTFGVAQYSDLSTPGSPLYDCYAISWSDSQIVCSTSAGIGIHLGVVVTVAQQPSNTDYTLSYHKPVITSIFPPSGSTRPTNTLTIIGDNFGPTGASVAIGPCPAQGEPITNTNPSCVCTVTSQFHDIVLCTPPTNFDRRLVRLSVGGQATLEEIYYQYAAPVITSATPLSSSTNGAIPITIRGTSFNYDGAVFFGDSNNPANECTRPSGSGGSSYSYDHTQVICRIPPGEGVNIPITIRQITTGLEYTTAVSPLFSYNAPVITLVQPSSIYTDGTNIIGATAPAIVTLTGSNFGLNPRVTLDGAQVTIHSRTHNSIEFIPGAGSGLGLPIVVDVVGQQSNIAVLDYRDPVITSITPQNGKTVGGERITIVGSSFGTNPAHLRISIGSALCDDVQMTTIHQVITCVTPPGSGVKTARVELSTGLSIRNSNPLAYRYSPPTITSITSSNVVDPTRFRTEGGDIMTLTGINFGLGTPIPTVLVAGTACLNPVVNADHTQLTCTTPTADGVRQTVLLVVDGLTTSTQTYNTLPPSITTVVPPLATTEGGQRLTITGDNFGRRANVSVGGRTCTVPADFTQTHTTYECIIPPGGGVVSLVMVALTQQSQPTQYAYGSPEFDEITPLSSSSRGGLMVITGRNFGIPSGGEIYIGSKRCVPTSTGVGWSHTQIQCDIPQGVGRDLQIALHRGSVVSIAPPAQFLFRYNDPIITSITGSVSTSAIGAQFAINGDNFGIDTTLSTFDVFLIDPLTDEELPCTVLFNSHQILQVRPPARYGVNYLVKVQFRDTPALSVISTDTFSYTPPAINGVTPRSVPTAGTASVTISGSSFGSVKHRVQLINPITSVVTDIPSDDISSWSHTQIVFKSPVGTGRGHVIRVHQYNHPSPSAQSSYTLDYDSPRITTVSPASVVTGPVSSSSSARHITITGTSFYTSGSVSINSQPCDVVSWAQDQIVCQPGIGYGPSLPLVVYSPDRSQVSNTFRFSYIAPTIQSVTANTAPTSGDGVVVTITGASFYTGSVDDNSITASVLFGINSECMMLTQDHSEITCQLPSYHGTQGVVVKLGTSLSNSVDFTYDAPTITSLSAPGATMDGGAVLTITGTNFSSSSLVTHVQVGGKECILTSDPPQDSATNPDHTILHCSLPPGGSTVDVIVVVDGQASNVMSFSYPAPTIRNFLPAIDEADQLTQRIKATAPIPTSGQILTLTGISFPLDGTVSVEWHQHGITAAATVTYRNRDSVQFIAPMGAGTNMSVTMEFGNTVPGSSPENAELMVHYQPPVITSITATSINTSGNSILTIQGDNFGSIDFYTRSQGSPDAPVFVIDEVGPCAIVSGTYSHTYFECVVPQGYGQDLAYTFSVGGQTASITSLPTEMQTLSYSPPRVTNVFPTFIPTEGGLLTLLGANFIRDRHLSSRVYITGSYPIVECTEPLPEQNVNAPWTDDRIICNIPSGYGPFELTVEVDHENSATSNHILSTTVDATFAVGLIESVELDNQQLEAAVSGGDILLIRGTNFDANLATLEVLISNLAETIQKPCDVLSATNSLITCRLPAFYGKSLRVRVFIDAIELDVSPAAIAQPVITYRAPAITSISSQGDSCTDSSSTVIECAMHVSSSQNPPAVIIMGTDLYSGNDAYHMITIDDVACHTVTPIDDSTHTQWLCVLPLAQTGTNLRVQATIGESENSSKQSSNILADAVSYRIPVITTVSFNGSDGVSNILLTSVTTPQVLTLTGDNFGTVSTGDISRVKVYVDNYTYSDNDLCTTDSVTCTNNQCTVVFSTPPKVGFNIPLFVNVETVNGVWQTSLLSAVLLSYPAPVVIGNTLRLRQNTPGGTAVIGTATQGQFVYFTATNVGTLLSSIKIFSTGVDSATTTTYREPCTRITSRHISGDEFALSCLMGPVPGYIGPFVFEVVAAGQSGVGSDTFTYPAPPVIHSVMGCPIDDSATGATKDCPTNGGINITITGLNFQEDSAAVRVGSRPCTVVSAGATQIICTLGQGTGLMQSVLVFSNSFYSAPRKLVSFKAPSASNLTITLPPSADPSKNCQIDPSNPLKLINCPRIPSNTAPFVPPQPDSHSNDVLYRPSIPSRMSTMAVPNHSVGFSTTDGLFSMQPLAFGANDVVITLTGSNFGESGALVYVGSQSFPAVHDPATPDTKISFTIPFGFGKNNPILVTQSGGGTISVGFVDFQPCPIGYFENPQLHTCDPCPSGSFNDNPDGVYQCYPCPPGQYQPTSGQPTCIDAPVGSHVPIGGSVSSTPCPAGTHQPDQGKAACIQCSSGTYTSAMGQAQCTDCLAGTYSNLPIAATGCTPCSPGYHAPDPRSNECQECLPGSFSAASNASRCDLCPPGSVQPLAGQSSCVSCGDGQYMDSSGQTKCLLCDSGSASSITPPPLGEIVSNRVVKCSFCPASSYSVKSTDIFATRGPTKCEACPAGKYSSTTGTQSCLECPSGTFNAGVGKTACTQCAAGTYQPDRGKTECVQCPAGFYTDISGAVVCNKCPLGTYSDEPGATSCKQCPTGSFQNETGQTSCKQCAAGFYNPKLGQSVCIGCHSGQFAASPGMATCTPCQAGYFSQRDSAIAAGPTECQACPAGTYTSATGQSSCQECAVGKYQASTGRSDCENCPAGTYSDVNGSTQCKLCSDFQPGSISSPGSSQCTLCTPGTYRIPGQQTCTPCPAGHYSDEFGATSCKHCPSGQYQENTGQSSCRSCRAGTFSVSSAANPAITCTKCSTGRFQDEIGQSTCKECSAGSYAPTEGQNECYDCPKGTFTSTSGQKTCTQCPVGQFNDLTGQSQCQNCVAGTYSPRTGLMGCLQCGAGEYQDLTGRSSCKKCDAGFVTPSAGHATCQACSPGHYTPGTGYTVCLECPSGTFQPESGQSECTRCPVGRFNSVSGISTECEVCKPGTYSNTLGATQCVECAAGTFQSESGATTCRSCPVGTFQASSGSTGCVDCSAGFYQSEIGQMQCLSCPSGHYTTHTRQKECQPCQVGRFSVNYNTGITECPLCPSGTQQLLPGQSSCVSCQKGHYSTPNGCEKCPVGHYQDQTNQSSCKQCPAGTYASTTGSVECLPCPHGHFSDAVGQSQCTACLPGTYQQESGQTTCNACPNGYITSAPGQTSCSACPKGTYYDNIISGGVRDTCSPCATGYYQDDTGQTSCKPCGLGQYTNAEGQETCLLCPAGQFNDIAAQSQCKKCAPGTFTGLTGQFSCTQCKEGTYTDFDGAFSCLSCPAGSYSDALGSTECTLCTPGHYNSELGLTSCSACQPGRYSASPGATACLLCEPGTFSALSASQSCSSCTPGSYQTVPGQTQCFSCPPGRYAPEHKSVECRSCSPGTFQALESQSECEVCQPGTYQDQFNAVGCKTCPIGTFTNIAGQNKCIACTGGTYQDETGQDACKTCEPGSFSVTTSQLAGPTACTDCGVGTYQSDSGQTFCLDCPSGFFQDSTRQSECKACGAGTYSYSPGSSSCTNCEPGKFSDIEAATDCLFCPLGQYQADSGQTSCLPCDPGTHAPVLGSLTCTDCAAGRYQPAAEQFTCIQCPAGKFSDAKAIQCIDCAPGSYTDTQGSSECKECSPGQYQTQPGQSFCNLCQPGRFSNTPDSSACEECPAGTYQPVPGGTECTECPPGQFNAETGQSSCRSCRPGSYSIDTGSTDCLPCEAGSFQSSPEQTGCELCPVGTFSEGGAAECITCPPGQVNAVVGSAQCVVCDPVTSYPDQFSTECLCREGLYLPNYSPSSPMYDPSLVYLPDTNDFKCLPCPTGAACDGGARWSSLESLDGWWRPTNDTDNFYRCLKPANCPGGLSQSNMYTERSGTQCAPNRVGSMCGYCADGFRETITSECVACPKDSDGWTVMIIIAIVITLLLILSVYLVWKAGEETLVKYHQKRAAENRQQEQVDFSSDPEVNMHAVNDINHRKQLLDKEAMARFERLHGTDTGAAATAAGTNGAAAAVASGDDSDTDSSEGVSDDVLPEDGSHYPPTAIESYSTNASLLAPPAIPPDFTYKLKIFLSFIQIITKISTVLEIHWPRTLRSIISFFDFLNLNAVLTSITAAECFEILGYYTEYVVVIVIPAIIIFLLLVFWVIPRRFRLFWWRNMSYITMLKSYMRSWLILLYALFLLYPVLSATILNHYVCKTIDDSVDSYRYLLVDLRVNCETSKWKLFSYIGIPFILLYPVGIPLFFFILLYRNRHQLADEKFKAKYGFLYAGYRIHLWWWEIVDCVHKLIMTSILAFATRETQLAIGMGVAILYIIALLIFNPYLRHHDDVLHLLCQNLLFIYLLAGYFLEDSGKITLTTLEDVGMTIALLIAGAVFILVFIYISLHTIKQLFSALRGLCAAKPESEQDDDELEEISDGNDDDNAADDDENEDAGSQEPSVSVSNSVTESNVFPEAAFDTSMSTEASGAPPTLQRNSTFADFGVMSPSPAPTTTPSTTGSNNPTGENDNAETLDTISDDDKSDAEDAI